MIKRWSVVVASSVVTFGLCLWLARSAPWGWMPHEESDRWMVAATFATVVTGAVGAAGGWWAAQVSVSRTEGPRRRVSQVAKASSNGRVRQVAGHQRTDGRVTGIQAPEEIDQRATASDAARIEQVGHDQHTDRQDSSGR